MSQAAYHGAISVTRPVQDHLVFERPARPGSAHGHELAFAEHVEAELEAAASEPRRTVDCQQRILLRGQPNRDRGLDEAGFEPFDRGHASGENSR